MNRQLDGLDRQIGYLLSTFPEAIENETGGSAAKGNGISKFKTLYKLVSSMAPKENFFDEPFAEND